MSSGRCSIDWRETDDSWRSSQRPSHGLAPRRARDGPDRVPRPRRGHAAAHGATAAEAAGRRGRHRGTLRYETRPATRSRSRASSSRSRSADGHVHRRPTTRRRFEVPLPGPGRTRSRSTPTRCPRRSRCRTRTAPRSPSTMRAGRARNRCCSRCSRRGRPATVATAVRPGRPAEGRGHPLRAGHRHVRHRPVADLRHHRPGQLRPRRDGHLRGARRLLLQRDDRLAVSSRPRSLAMLVAIVTGSASTGASGGRCATGARPHRHAGHQHRPRHPGAVHLPVPVRRVHPRPTANYTLQDASSSSGRCASCPAT